MERILAGCHGLPLEELVDRLDEASSRFAGPARDDLAIVALRARPGGRMQHHGYPSGP